METPRFFFLLQTLLCDINERKATNQPTNNPTMPMPVPNRNHYRIRVPCFAFSLLLLAFANCCCCAITMHRGDNHAIVSLLASVTDRSRLDSMDCVSVDHPNASLEPFVCTNDSRLHSVNFSGQGLAGQLNSVHMASLDRLRSLDLSKNLLTSFNYADLERLKSLETLDLSRNKFSGDILAHVWALPKLVDCALISDLPVPGNCFAGSIAGSLSLCNTNGTRTMSLCVPHVRFPLALPKTTELAKTSTVTLETTGVPSANAEATSKRTHLSALAESSPVLRIPPTISAFKSESRERTSSTSAPVSQSQGIEATTSVETDAGDLGTVGSATDANELETDRARATASIHEPQRISLATAVVVSLLAAGVFLLLVSMCALLAMQVQIARTRERKERAEIMQVDCGPGQWSRRPMTEYVSDVDTDNEEIRAGEAREQQRGSVLEVYGRFPTRATVVYDQVFPPRKYGRSPYATSEELSNEYDIVPARKEDS